MSVAPDVAVSVVIPTHNRAASLRRTLDALAIQSYPADRMEVIVVADGCRDSTKSMVGDYQSMYALRLLELDGAGAATARNTGAAAANGQLLVFLDDDIEPRPGLVEAHARAHADEVDRVTLGPSLPALGNHLDFFRIELRAWWNDYFAAMRDPGHRFTYHSLAAGNFAIGRALFARLGGFDSAFRGSGGEDWEFALRLLHAGAQFAYVQAAQGHHFDARDLRQSLRRKRQEGRADVIIGRRHADLRASLNLARFRDPDSPLGSLVREVAFVAPGMGQILAQGFFQVLRLLELAHMRGLWRKLHGRLNEFWYWRGVVDELLSREALVAFLEGDSSCSSTQAEVELDLADGVHAAVRCLDERRPPGAILTYRGQRVGQIPAQTGAEPLRGAHLQAILATDLSDRLLKVIAVQTASGSPIHSEWRPLVFGRTAGAPGR